MTGFALLLIVAASILVGATLTIPFASAAAIPAPRFDISDEHIARIAHEANRAYCITIGDLSKRAWQNEAPAVRESAIAGVRALRANPDLTPAELHDRWADFKRSQGYTYGTIVCHRERTHNCLVPYDELPEAQRFKDYLFRAIVSLASTRG